MTSLDLIPRDLDQIKLLREAAEGRQGMIALFIPFPSDQDHEKPVGDHQLSHLPASDNDRPSRIHGTATSLTENFIRLRRQRDKIFGGSLFADPAWDMLLDLFVAQEKGLRPVSTSSLCIASAVPATTALRWIETLVQQGLVSRHADPKDGRRVFVRLTDEAWQKMRDLLTPWTEKT